MGTDSNGWNRARGLAFKALLFIGGALLVKRLRKSTTRWDHARLVAHSLTGEKYSKDQASRDPDNYFNIRMRTCPAAELVDGSEVLYFEQAFWRSPQKPFRQRFLMAKPCPKELTCDVEDIAEHLTTIHLKRCSRGKRCLYEGSSPPGGFPNSWNGATYCTSELAVMKKSEIHTWDRGYDDDGNQVWGQKEGPYKFKPAPTSCFNDMFPPLNLSPTPPMERRIQGSFILEE
ncbi:chromophore lyase CRL, chloroplastic isoform X2 [Lathyrus oleraceus]|uniref:chromophore lyase CRL, chloroplastic isoform X2 n=1 Tax=Pisum sativum TaxID=3888 RepID=UPI0021CE9BA8|nr:chromophore lyase CRL, chloroplastic isoform X2 [Pisum sativum]